MSIYNFKLIFLSALSLGALCGVTHTANAATSRLSFDFNATPMWKGAKPYASSATLGAKAQWAKVGSYDTAASAEQSGGWRVGADASKTTKAWSAGLTSGVLPFSNTETNLGKLTLAFTLSASANRPVKVKIASLNAKGARTGGLEALVYPAAPDFLQRYALDLNTFKPSGTGKFDPKAPQIQLAFEMDSSVWPRAKNEIRVDNVNLSAPAWYVSPGGKDTNDGKTEATAFATPQKAVDVTGPGDIILLMEGTYDGGLSPTVSFRRAGAPAAWIVLKNYPGQHPTLTGNGWNIVSMAAGSKEKMDETTTLAYLEMRGLHVRGEGDVAKTKYPEAMNKPDSRTNSNGIAADGRFMKNLIHHIRFADNLVEYCPAQGLGCTYGDWVTIENNISRFNCWTTIYATSGISTLGPRNFDGSQNIYRNLIRNNVCYRNETYEIWQQVNRVSDGNGIIIDVNQHTDVNQNLGDRPQSKFTGRTLVQSNLSFMNGGSGIHTVEADHVDIINNTAFMNSASKSLQYSQIYTYGSDDVRIMNNILVAPVADVAAGEKPEPVNRISGKNGTVTFSHNLYYGGNIAPFLGEGDQIGDPQFVNPPTAPKSFDFHLRAGSPALGKGIVLPFGPFLNLDDQPRGVQPNIGAF